MLLLAKVSHVAVQICGDVLAVSCQVSGNASWALGVIPEDEIDNPMFFFTGLRVGVNSKDTTRSSLLPRENVHGLWVEIVVDVKRKHVLIRCQVSHFT